MRKKLLSALHHLQGNAREHASYQDMLESQDNFFRGLRVEPEEIEKECRRLLQELDSETEPSLSFHLVAFTALARSGWRPRNILELGTFQGKATALLSALFPEATVYTVDLPDTDAVFAEEFKDKIDADRARLARRLDRPNIRSIRSNTAWILKNDLPDFDLIWVDAWHKYPEVAWDHMYSMNKLTPGGWLLSDDIYLPDSAGVREDATKGHTFEIVHYFHVRTDRGFRLVPKRRGQGASPTDQKYIGYFHRQS